MDSERARRVESVFACALALEPGERATYISDACADDEPLRREVLSLLDHHERATGLLKPLAAMHSIAARSERRAWAPSDAVGAYRIVRWLGAGGMGEVYLAEDPRLGRKVALKFLPLEATHNPDLVRRFQVEARAASALNHPNILTIYDVGFQADHHFIVSEFVDGTTLREQLRRGLVSVERAVDVAAQVASALQAAHAAGIVHRDIKPENVMVRPDGYVKILDFGLAKLVEQLSASGHRDEATRTRPGAVFGTLAYMSPEQGRGEVVDARTDLWSWGVVFYEMLVGDVPFRGPTPSHTAVQILESEPPPFPAARAIPARLQRIALKALHKDVAYRYQTASQIVQDLKTTAGLPDAVVSVPRLVGIPSRPKRWRTLALLGGSIIAVLIAALGRDRIVRPPQPIAAFEGTRLTTAGSVVQGVVAISPDGQFVAYAKEQSGAQSLRLRQVGDQADIERVPPDDGPYVGVTFSRDSRQLYYVRQDRKLNLNVLYRVAVLGTSPRLLLRDVDSAVTFAPDGRSFAFVRILQGGSALVVADVDSLSERTLTTRKAPDYFAPGPIGGIAWSPTGDTIAAGAYQSSADGRRLMKVLEIDSGDGRARTVRSPEWQEIGQMGWLSPEELLFPARAQGAPSYQLTSLRLVSGEARRIAGDLNMYTGVSVTNAPVRVVTVQDDRLSAIWMAPEHDPSSAVQLTSQTARFFGASWTSQGQLLSQSIMGGKPDLWLVEPSTGEQTPLTRNDATEWGASAPAAGRFAVFASDQTGNWNLWRTELDGTKVTQLTSGGGMDMQPSVSPDGESVVFVSARSGMQTLWRVPTKGGEPQQLTSYLARSPVVSPDGRLVLCEYSLDPTRNAWVVGAVPIAGGQPVMSFPDVPVPATARWVPDGTGVAYVVTRDGISNLWVQPLASGAKPRALTSFAEGRIFAFAWSAVSRNIAYVRGVLARDVALFAAMEEQR